MKIKTLLTFIIVIFSSEAYSTNVRVVDFQKIIENNNNLKFLYKQIQDDQNNHQLKFKEEELNLENEFAKIEKLNLILDPTEMDKEIQNYNNKLKNFNEKIEKFNLHYELQINELKNQLVNILLAILKKYSLENQIELILDSNNYILSNNSINITDIIIELLNKEHIETSFEKY